MSDLSNKMMAYRAKHDMSLEDLAKKCNLSKQTVWAVENEFRKPTNLTEWKIRNVVEEKE